MACRSTTAAHTCDMTLSYMWHDSFIHVTWLLHTCDMTPSYMCDVICTPRHMREALHSNFLWILQSAACVSACLLMRLYSLSLALSLSHSRALSRPLSFSLSLSLSRVRARTRAFPMGRLRLVGSLKSWVSFAKEPYKRDYILQKRPIIVRGLLISATPYLSFAHSLSLSHLKVAEEKNQNGKHFVLYGKCYQTW